MEFAVPADHRVKLNESEKRDKYQDLAREKTLENESDCDTNSSLHARYSHQRKGPEDLEIRVRAETIQTAGFLIWARILRRVLEV